MADLFDVVIVADMTRPGEPALRIAGSIEALRAAGFRTGLLHLDSPLARRQIASPVRAAAETCGAVPTDPAWAVDARLAIVLSPQHHGLTEARLRRIAAPHVLAIADVPHEIDVARKERVLRRLFGPVTWAACDPWGREALMRKGAGLTLADDLWLPVAAAGHSMTRGGAGPAGLIVAAGEEPIGAAGLPEGTICLLAGPQADAVGVLPQLPGRPPVFAAGDLPVRRFLARSCVIGFSPDGPQGALPDATIAAAMASGRAVVLADWLEAHYGPGPEYCTPEDFAGRIAALVADPLSRERAEARAAEAACRRFGPAGQIDLVERLVGAERRGAVSVRRTARPRERALLVSLAGDAAEGPADLLAIAGALGQDRVAAIATTGDDCDAIEAHGVLAEHLALPGVASVGSPAAPAWLAAEIDHLAEAHQASFVLLAAADPPPALLRELAGGSGRDIGWLVRPCEDGRAPDAAGLAPTLDLVLVPADPAQGPQAGSIAGASAIEAIILGPSGRLSRAEAASRLGLDPGRPALLVRLEDARNLDLVSALQALAGLSGDLEGLQIVVHSRWVAGVAARVVPGAIALAAPSPHPFMAAFDLQIVPADHATFHQALATGPATIFVPDAHAARGGQRLRAAAAEAAEAALDLRAERLSELPQMLRVLMAPQAREHLTRHARAMARCGGGGEAAGLIAAVMDEVGGVLERA